MDPLVDELLAYARQELVVLREQGCDTWEWERMIELFDRDPGPDPLKRLRGLLAGIAALEPAEDFAYEETSSPESIRARRPEGPRRIAVALPPEALDDRTLGAWQGRVAGCMLGKPVEGWSREKMLDLLDVCGIEELTDYFPEPDEDRPGLRYHDSSRGALRGRIRGAVRDDDIDYTIIGLCILERHGREFTPRQVADFWLEHLPYMKTYTAERAAYRNFVEGVWPPASATRLNPFREWIGAQIRADAFGYACPGRPEEAASLAFKDACISHTRNGIYGEMWVAAMLAAAFVADRPEKAIRIGLTEIPANCRLAEAVNQVLDWREAGLSARDATTALLAEFGHYHAVHVINNAAIVAMALLWGGKDFSRTIGLAVEAGLDTDCNGATAGSVLGAIIGAGAIPAHWTDPLEDRLATIVAGQSDLTISGLAARTQAVQAMS